MALDHLIQIKSDVIETLPFLHLRGWDVNAVSLATTAHGEVHIQGGEVVASVARGDNIEGGGVVEDMIVEGEFTTEYCIN